MDCLHSSTIIIALWNIIYSIFQIVIFAWQTKYVKNQQWEFENRLILSDGTINVFQARFLGLYGILTETPERRRINALFSLAIVSLIVALMHLILSVILFYGAITVII
ncbi:putative integral membrane protein [Acanthocheilonema viteae]